MFGNLSLARIRSAVFGGKGHEELEGPAHNEPDGDFDDPKVQASASPAEIRASGNVAEAKLAAAKKLVAISHAHLADLNAFEAEHGPLDDEHVDMVRRSKIASSRNLRKAYRLIKTHKSAMAGAREASGSFGVAVKARPVRPNPLRGNVISVPKPMGVWRND